MAPSGLRDSHLSHLRAAASSSRSASPVVSRGEWLRSQEQLIKEVDPSFDSSLLCPISIHGPGSPNPRSPSPCSPSPCSPGPGPASPGQSSPASSSYPSPLGTPSAASGGKASSAVALPSNLSLFWPSPGRDIDSNSLSPYSTGQGRPRAQGQEEDGRSLVKSTSSRIERLHQQPPQQSFPGSGPLAPSHVPEQHQHASRAGAGAARHRLSQSRGPHLQAHQRPGSPSATVEGPASPNSQSPAGPAGTLAASDFLQRSHTACKQRGLLSLDQSAAYPAARGKAAANLDTQSTKDASSTAGGSPSSRAYQRGSSVWQEQGVCAPVANSSPEGNWMSDRRGEGGESRGLSSEDSGFPAGSLMLDNLRPLTDKMALLSANEGPSSANSSPGISGRGRLIKVSTQGVGNQPATTLKHSYDLASRTVQMSPGLNFQDVQRASEELDQAGEFIESITIIDAEDAGSLSGLSSTDVLFAISSTKRQ